MVTPFNPGDPGKVVLPRGLISNYHAVAASVKGEDSLAEPSAGGEKTGSPAIGKVPGYDSLTEDEHSNGEEEDVEDGEHDAVAAEAKRARKAKRRLALAAKRDKLALKARKAASKDVVAARRSIRRLLAWIPPSTAAVGAVFPVQMGAHTDIGVRPWCATACTWSIEAWILLGFEKDLAAMMAADDDDEEGDGFGGGDEGMGFGGSGDGFGGGGNEDTGTGRQEVGGIGQEIVLMRRLEPTTGSMARGKQLLEAREPAGGPAAGAVDGVIEDPKQALRSIHPEFEVGWELFVSSTGQLGFRCRKPAIAGQSAAGTGRGSRVAKAKSGGADANHT